MLGSLGYALLAYILLGHFQSLDAKTTLYYLAAFRQRGKEGREGRCSQIGASAVVLAVEVYEVASEKTRQP